VNAIKDIPRENHPSKNYTLKEEKYKMLLASLCTSIEQPTHNNLSQNLFEINQASNNLSDALLSVS